MRKILKQIMLEYIRLFVPVYPIDEELLEFNETEDKYELYYHKLNLSAEYDAKTDALRVYDWELGEPIVMKTFYLNEDLERSEEYIIRLKEQVEKDMQIDD